MTAEENFKEFKKIVEFIKSLDDAGKLVEVDNIISDAAITDYVLKSFDVRLDSKVSLILTKINNNTFTNVLEKYISSVSEIASLSNVWNGKQPLLDNEYKEKVGQALIEAGYVKPRKDKLGRRIMI